MRESVGLARHPVGAVEEEAERVAVHDDTPTRAHGVSARCARTMARSATTASSDRQHEPDHDRWQVEAELEAAREELSETADADQGGDRHHADVGDGGHPQPGEDHRQGQRELDGEPPAYRRVAHGRGGLHGLRLDRGQAVGGRADQQRDAVEGEGDDDVDRVEDAGPDQAGQQEQQRERREWCRRCWTR